MPVPTETLTSGRFDDPEGLLSPPAREESTMYVAPVRLSEEEQEFARLMSEPPTPHAEAVAFARSVERDQDADDA